MWQIYIDRVSQKFILCYFWLKDSIPGAGWTFAQSLQYSPPEPGYSRLELLTESPPEQKSYNIILLEIGRSNRISSWRYEIKSILLEIGTFFNWISFWRYKIKSILLEIGTFLNWIPFGRYEIKSILLEIGTF